MTIHLCPPRRPQTKGKVEKQVDTIREWFFRGRGWTDLADLNAQGQTWHREAWLPHVHRTTGSAIATRLPEDQAALRLLPPQPYEVCERTTRQVGKDCRFSFEGSLYSAPAAYAGQRIALRLFPDRVVLYSLEPVPRQLGAPSRVRSPLMPGGTPLAALDVPVVHRPLTVYALVGAGKEASHE